jgi:thioredoxin reductase
LIDIAIIGAGPYGLSLAAHLQAAGASFRIFGKTMESWRHRMPPGMLLKSHAWSSCIYHPENELTLEAFCRQQGACSYDPEMEVPLDLYCRYGKAFQARFAPDLAEKLAVDITAVPGGFRAVFDDGEAVSARKIVVAVGVHAFSHVPEGLAWLPPEALSHSGDYGPLDRLDGREVVVVGSGASAIDLAALLQERGVSTSLLARADRLNFAPPRMRSQRPLLHRLARPYSGIGAGWLLWACANAPSLIHDLPGPVRRHLVRNTLGPLGGPSMKDRLFGKAAIRLGRRLECAALIGGRVELSIRDESGGREVVAADHVVAATGYRPDVERLAFLNPGLRRQVRTVAGAPVLSQDYESSVPGLHFIGPVAADSFGPVARFVFGAVYPARRLARRFAAEATRQPAPLPAARPLAAAEQA